MRVLITRLRIERRGLSLAPRTYAWTVPDTEKLWAFHAHAKDSFGFYEARPYSLET